MNKPRFFIIYTLFDSISETYLKKLGMSSQITAKGFSYNRQWDDLAGAKTIPDVVLLPDGGQQEQVLKQAIFENREAYVILHKGSPDKSIQKKELFETLGGNLQYPILEMHHNAGYAYDALKALAEARKQQACDVYHIGLNKLKELFSFDFDREARIELLHLIQTNKGLEEVLNGVFPRADTAPYIQSLIKDRSVAHLLKSLRTMEIDSNEYERNYGYLISKLFSEMAKIQ